MQQSLFNTGYLDHIIKLPKQCLTDLCKTEKMSKPYNKQGSKKLYINVKEKTAG